MFDISTTNGVRGRCENTNKVGERRRGKKRVPWVRTLHEDLNIEFLSIRVVELKKTET